MTMFEQPFDPLPSMESLQKILNVPPPFSDEEDETVCRKLAATLTVEQQEILARTSYAYLASSLLLTSTSTATPTTPEADNGESIRLNMCLREIRRHLVGWDYEYTAKALQATCQYRKEYHADVLRTCFQEGIVYATEEVARVAELYRSYISRDLQLQLAVVRGHDKEGCAIVLIFPRVSVESYSDEAFIITQLYVMERAIACTEALSEGRQEKVVAVLDFGHFKSSFSPSLMAIKKLASLLQYRYPERLKNLMVIDPPFWIRAMYAIVGPFVDPDTRKKFILVSSDQKKQEILSNLVDLDQAMPFMLPGGKLTSPIDVNRYTTQTPFHCLYDFKHDEKITKE